MEAKTTCHSRCGCSCGHNKGEEHPNVVLPILSFILLIVGLILNHTGQGWFSPTVKLVWYLAAFLPEDCLSYGKLITRLCEKTSSPSLH